MVLRYYDINLQYIDNQHNISILNNIVLCLEITWRNRLFVLTV